MSESNENKSGVGIYVIGAIILALGIGLIVFLTSGEKPKQVTTSAPAAVTTEEPFMAPPPPPPPKKTAEPEDAGEDAGDDAGDGGEDAAPVSTGGKVSVGSGGGSCSKCSEGKASSALTGAVQGTAGAARGCYNRVINKSGAAAEGKMTVVVAVGSGGQVCSATIAGDTVGSPDVSNCVLKQFQGKSFPKPDEGCVTYRLPINFAVKKDK